MKQLLLTTLLALGCLSVNAQSKASYTDGTLTVNGVRYEFALVESGTFTMGRPEVKADENEYAGHQVTLTSYYLGKTEVTQALWKAVMGNNPSHFKGDNKPVEHVSWNYCQTFIARLNLMTGMNFRLPTEAEWEFAARGGNKSRNYESSGSNDLNEVGWYTRNSGNTTHDVATKKPNELGIYDMSGNVWEWCNDWHGWYSGDAQSNPTGPESGSFRTLRGGSWDDDWECHSVARYASMPTNSDLIEVGKLGFRLCISE